MLTRRTVIQAGLEGTTYGVHTTEATSPILAWDVDLDISGEVLNREILRDTISAAPHVIGMKEVKVSFKTEVRANTAGTLPEMGVLLSACGFGTASLTGTGAASYALESSEANIWSATLAVYKDGNRHLILGARGNVNFIFEAGKYGIAEWEFSGLYGTVHAVALPDMTGAGDIKPPICYAANFQVGGFSPVSNKLELNLGNTVARRDNLNATYGVQAFRLTNREGKMSFNADAVVESSNPFWGDWAGNVVDTYSIMLPGNNTGALAGSQERVLISGFYQYEKPKYEDADGISQYACEASLCSSSINSQDDEVAITFGYTASA